MITMKWPPTFKDVLGTFDKMTWVLAQETHILLSILTLVFAEAYNIPLWVGAVAIMGFALLKETLIDPYDFEHNPFFWNGIVDWAFYGVGVGIGLTLIYVANFFGLGHLFGNFGHFLWFL